MFTIGAYIIGFVSGIAFYYWLAHKTNPTAAQATLDSAKAAATTAVANPVVAEVTKIEDEVKTAL